MSSSRALVSASLIAASSAASSLPCSRIEFEDRPAAVFEFAQIGEARLQRAQLRVVERAGRLLPVAGDERHGRTLVQKPDRGGDLGGLDVQLLGDAFGDGFHGSRISSVGRAPLVGAPAPAGQSRSPSLATASIKARRRRHRPCAPARFFDRRSSPKGLRRGGRSPAVNSAARTGRSGWARRCAFKRSATMNASSIDCSALRRGPGLCRRSGRFGSRARGRR